MKWLNLISSVFLVPPEAPGALSERLMQTKEDATFSPNLPQYILYEYFLPIDAIVFLMGAYHPSRNEIRVIIRLVLAEKAMLLTGNISPEIFTNFSTISRGPSDANKVIKSRNDIIRSDDSLIALELTKEVQADIRERVRRQKQRAQGLAPGTEGTVQLQPMRLDGLDLKDPEVSQRDKEYTEMIHRLKNVVYNNGPIGRSIAFEKEEFYRTYRKVAQTEILKTKIELSLGSSVINTAMMPLLINSINISDKEDKVRKWINKLMALVEDLELKVRTKSIPEAKRIVTDFLNSCLRPGGEDFDTVFELRAEIIGLISGNKTQTDYESWQQEKHIRRLIDTVQNMRNVDWLIKYNKDIRDDYAAFLLTGQSEDKQRLLSHFA